MRTIPSVLYMLAHGRNVDGVIWELEWVEERSGAGATRGGLVAASGASQAHNAETRANNQP